MINKSRVFRWAKELFKIIILITIVTTAMDIWRSQQMPSDAIPPLAANSIKQEWLDIETMSHDKPVLIYFWATWCPACRVVSPSVNWFSDDHHVVSVAITSGEDQRLNQYMTYKKYDFPVINDRTGSISKEWGVSATPTIVIVKDGEISSITTGVTTPMGMWLRLLFA
ncbi:MAG: protein disulfide oxidoreductase [Aliivibrio sp.]|uniref:protein disulfide oxidoreductase n=1 Tax=Aliivibrio sp. TaxID=1872443 RepID=UPI001A423A4A|nr:protein disulfide oxidoreductase [Aliivibrio sp.]